MLELNEAGCLLGNSSGSEGSSQTEVGDESSRGVRPKCLPLGHPEYRYPQSTNPYWKKLHSLQNKVFSDNQTELHRGSWLKQFELPLASLSSESAELHVEIGCNAGHVIVEQATQNPNRRYIGMDWKFKPIFRGAEKGIKRNLKNLIFFRAHAERLPYMFGESEIDHLSLYFPDPWQKKSQWKNRFVTAERLREVARVVKPSGVFHIKTDHPGYFEWICDAVSQCADTWKVIELTRNLHENHPAPHLLDFPVVTLFEKLFIKDGIPIQSMKLQRIK